MRMACHPLLLQLLATSTMKLIPFLNARLRLAAHAEQVLRRPEGPAVLISTYKPVRLGADKRTIHYVLARASIVTPVHRVDNHDTGMIQAFLHSSSVHELTAKSSRSTNNSFPASGCIAAINSYPLRYPDTGSP